MVAVAYMVEVMHNGSWQADELFFTEEGANGYITEFTFRDGLKRRMKSI